MHESGNFFKDFGKKNLQNWENKDPFLIGKDSLIYKVVKWPNKITVGLE